MTNGIQTAKERPLLLSSHPLLISCTSTAFIFKYCMLLPFLLFVDKEPGILPNWFSLPANSYQDEKSNAFLINKERKKHSVMEYLFVGLNKLTKM